MYFGDKPKLEVSMRNFKETQPLSAKNQIIKDKREALAKALTKKNKSKEFNADLNNKMEALREKYGDLNFGRYEVIHALFGSTMEVKPDPDYYITDDFPKEDSIHKFIDFLVKKYQI